MKILLPFIKTANRGLITFGAEMMMVFIEHMLIMFCHGGGITCNFVSVETTGENITNFRLIVLLLIIGKVTSVAV